MTFNLRALFVDFVFEGSRCAPHVGPEQILHLVVRKIPYLVLTYRWLILGQSGRRLFLV